LPITALGLAANSSPPWRHDAPGGGPPLVVALAAALIFGGARGWLSASLAAFNLSAIM
jgi:hypothetical protein